MKIVWVRSNKLFSKLIMWVLEEPVSHMAIVFDNKIVFHADLMGVRLAWYPTFLKTHQVVEEIDFDLSLQDEEEVYQSIITANDGKPYDYGAFAYFTYRGLLRKCFGTPLPEKNPWGSEDRYLCDEMVEVLPDWIIPQSVKEVDIGMKSPWQVYLLLKATLK